MNKSGKQIALGAILSYVQIALGAIITLFYTPFIIRVLGQSEYGLYNTVSSVVSSLSILSLGFGSCYVRFFSQYKSESKEKEIQVLNGMFMTIFIVIGLVALGCGLFLSMNLQIVFKDGLTSMELITAKKLMILLTVNLAISFPCSVFTSIITANEQFIFQKLVLLIKQVASPLICIPMLLMGYASVGIVITTVAVYLMMDFCNGLFCIVKLKTRFQFGHFDLKVFKNMAVYSGFIAINMIVDQINLNIDKFLLGRYRGTTSVAVYSAGYTLYHYYMIFSTSISNVFIPRIHHIWNETKSSLEDKNKRLSLLFAKVGRIQFVILLLVCSGIVLFGKQFIKIWAGVGYDNAYYVLVLLAISAIVPLTQNIGIEIQRAQNKHQFRAILYAFMAVVNLVLSIFLCQLYGEIGSAIGTAISFIIANTILMNIFYYKVLNIDISLYWKSCIRCLISALPACGIGFAYCKTVNTYKASYMLMGIGIYSVAYLLCIFLLSCNKDEKKSVIDLVKKKIKH